MLHKPRHKLLVNRQNRKPGRPCNSSRMSCLRLRPETSLALLMMFVFYLYIGLSGAMFLLLEGQAIPSQQKEYNTSYSLLPEILPICEMWCGRWARNRNRGHLWSFLEATDYTYQILTGQGTGQTSRVLKAKGSKIAYILFVMLGVPIAVSTFTATGHRLNVFSYDIIRFLSVRLLCRKVTRNIHAKALVLNLFLVVTAILAGSAINLAIQGWLLVDSIYFTTNVLFTIGNFEDRILNGRMEANSHKENMTRAFLNIYSFVGHTVFSSFLWSAYRFVKHVRFRAQNRRLARRDDARWQRPGIEIASCHTLPPANKSHRERETDRESVC